MKQLKKFLTVLCLLTAGSANAVNYTRDSGDTRWSNLDQWNDNSSGSYSNSTSFPTTGDLVLLNGGKMLSVDTNAFAGTVVIPNAASSSATLILNESASGYTLTANSINVGIVSQIDSIGKLYQSDGTVSAGNTTVAAAGTGSAVYEMLGGVLSSTALKVGSSSAAATGTAEFMQPGGTVTSPNITIGGTGSATWHLSGGALHTTGTLNVNTNGRLNVDGSAPVITAGTLNTEPGSEISFTLDASGISTVQISGNMNLENAFITVDGSLYSGGATNYTLLNAGLLVSMAVPGNISISGLVDASVSQVGDSVVLSVVESKTPVTFENTSGDGLWGTADNWSSGMVPSGAVNAVVSSGKLAVISAPAPEISAATVSGNATLEIQSEFSAAILKVESQSTLKFNLGFNGIVPSRFELATFDPSSQLIVEGTEYEGMDGYFPLILATDLPAGLTNAICTGFGQREPALVMQDDGLWLRLIAPPSLSKRLCALIPESTVAADYSNSVFSFTREYDPSGSAWSLSLSEGHVMDTRISQAMIGSGAANLSWDMRLARGGNIYSLRTPALGETVPPSYRSDGDSSPWNDEVWQSVAVGPLNNSISNSPYFMHQSGVYTGQDPSMSKPFYSPQMAAFVNEADRSFTTINWTPHAHVKIYTDENAENDWKSYLLAYTRYRDLGQGVIEVSEGYYNYGPDLLDFHDMPWGGVRRTSTEYAFLSDPGGTTWSEPLTNGFGPTTIRYNLTGGWVGFSASSDGTSPALGLVFGSDHDTPLPNQKYPYSLFRPGYAGGAFQSGETDWRNYYVIECIRRYNLFEGNGFWSRYYFVLGDDIPDLAARIASRNLVDAELRAMEYTESETPLVAYSFTGSGSSFRVTENSRTPQFFLYAFPVTGSVPIFEIIENDENRYLTWNPYANGIIKPYDGTIAGMRLLGFSMPESGTNGTYTALSGVLPSKNYMADGKSLFARTATSIETWRVEYFGFTDDAGEGANSANPDNDAGNNFYAVEDRTPRVYPWVSMNMLSVEIRRMKRISDICLRSEVRFPAERISWNTPMPGASVPKAN
ncbi:hypothetical protein P4E94_18825 [Pontiellaceae bacterium B12219]|nr:hypothetical protein [Pontiellaceae bacterium B12219]